MVSEVSVSRQHAELRPEGGHYVLHAVGSTPTYLNDERMNGPRTLHSRDTIVIGTMRFVFVRGQLPVAIQLAPSIQRVVGVNDQVSDRRPTLTFPVQPVPQLSHGGRRRLWPWIALVILLFVVALAITDYLRTTP